MGKSLSPSRHYLTLDAARGVAAIAVMLLHINTFVYPDLRPASATAFLHHSYLAVDLFFLMSGLVICRAYEAQILQGRMNFLSFCITRGIRLLPLYLGGTLLGFLYAGAKAQISHDGSLHIGTGLTILLFNGIFIPDFTESIHGLFPFDGAAWSLALEWVINLLYAAFAVRLSVRGLSVLTIVFAIMLTISALSYGSLDMGWGTSTFGGGMLRVCFSFTLGIILQRLINRGTLPQFHMSALVLLAIIALCLVTPFGRTSDYYDLFATFVVFPAFVIVSCFSGPGEFLFGLFHELGRISYGVYILHTPLIMWFGGLWKIVAKSNPATMPAVSLPLLLIAILTSCWLATAYLDEPIRQWLAAKFLSKPPSP